MHKVFLIPCISLQILASWSHSHTRALSVLENCTDVKGVWVLCYGQSHECTVPCQALVYVLLLVTACSKHGSMLQWSPPLHECLRVWLFSTLLQCRGSFSTSVSFIIIFFPNADKSFIIIIKISLFCILQYISNISIMKHELVQCGQEADSLR